MTTLLVEEGKSIQRPGPLALLILRASHTLKTSLSSCSHTTVHSAFRPAQAFPESRWTHSISHHSHVGWFMLQQLSSRSCVCAHPREVTHRQQQTGIQNMPSLHTSKQQHQHAQSCITHPWLSSNSCHTLRHFKSVLLLVYHGMKIPVNVDCSTY